MFNIIVAYCRGRGIGIANRLPWRSVSDLQHFKHCTMGYGDNAVIMGRRTWDSLPKSSRPLPKRANIILSRSLDQQNVGGASVFGDIASAKAFCKRRGYKQVWIIGGENLYKQFLVDEDLRGIYVTEVDSDFVCDKFFPPLPSRYSLAAQTSWQYDDVHPLRYMTYMPVQKKPDCIK